MTRGRRMLFRLYGEVTVGCPRACTTGDLKDETRVKLGTSMVYMSKHCLKDVTSLTKSDDDRNGAYSSERNSPRGHCLDDVTLSKKNSDTRPAVSKRRDLANEDRMGKRISRWTLI